MTRPASVSATGQNARLGIVLMVATTFVFAIQDTLTRHLAQNYSLLMVVMIRFWAFGAFVILLAARAPGGLRATARTAQLPLQILRGLVLTLEIAVMALAFVHLGLVETHAIFTAYPLIVAALSGPILGESVGWRRWPPSAPVFLAFWSSYNRAAARCNRRPPSRWPPPLSLRSTAC